MAIKKKFLSGTPAEAVDGSKVLFSNNEAFRVKNASGVAEEIFKLDTSNVLKLLKLPQVAADPSAADDLVRKSFLDGQVSTLNSAISAESTARATAISAEVTARQAAIAEVVSDYQAADAVIEGDLAAEVTAREAAVETLDGKIDQEIFDRSAADSLLDGRVTTLETDMGVLKGNATVAGSVDYKVKQAVDALVDGAPGAYDTLKEIADYLASDEGAGTALVGRVGVLEGKVETLEGGIEVVGSVAYSVEQEKVRAMQAETELTNLITSEIEGVETQINSLLNDLGVEETAREAGDNALSLRLDIIEGSGVGSVAKALLDALAYTDAEVLAEEQARISGDQALEQRLDVVQGIGPNSIFQSLVDAKAYTDQEINELSSTLTMSIGLVQSDLAEEETARIDGDASTLASAQSYTDGEIVAIKGGVSESYDTLGKIEAKIGFIMSNVDGAALDSLTEIVAAFQGADSNINTAISNLASTASTNLAAEQTRAQAAEAALGVRIDGVESDLSAEESARIAGDASTLVDAKAYTDAQLDTLVIQQQQYEAKTLGAGATYVDVSGPIVSTPWVMIDGVMGRPNVDFTWSGSRITFAGEWASGGASELVQGDILHVFFMKNYSPFV